MKMTATLKEGVTFKDAMQTLVDLAEKEERIEVDTWGGVVWLKCGKGRTVLL